MMNSWEIFEKRNISFGKKENWKRSKRKKRSWIDRRSERNESRNKKKKKRS